ncbi:NAD(P)/FAD-dependent oxidoreductase [Parapusillimonas sp. JC17]|uniref:NAD(P)/FAD-dependent oxidoreductase n=1 Tax=Parapusillimonas sp. JC17 TaxID=3445768 RepID=UPI003F9ED525
MEQRGECAVVGAGIIGVCIAYELVKRGIHTVLIDKDEPGKGASYGNSGAISPASVAPLAMPGVLASVPSMLGHPDSPLFLPWRYLPRALPWLARFVWASRPSAVEKSAVRLAEVHQHAVSLHEALAREVGAPEVILKRGHLHLYPNDRALNGDRASWHLRERHGISFTRLERSSILDLEPHAPEGYRVGIYLEDQATLRNPFRYLQAIFRKFIDGGGQFIQANVRSLKNNGSSGWMLDTSVGAIDTQNIVVAAGAWSRHLLRPLGIQLPLETQRGYHVQFRNNNPPVSRTVVLTDHKTFFTPMEDGLRVGGTVEFAGLKAAPNPHRADILVRIAKNAFPELEGQPYDTWMGHRPCMPDSVPVIGQSEKLPGLWLAVGHGHLGLTDSVGTAITIADGMLRARGQTPDGV